MALHAKGGLIVGGRTIAWVGEDGETRDLLAPAAIPGAIGFNDLTTDAAGRVYVGSLAFRVFADPPKPGFLHLIDLDGAMRTLSDGVILTNGLGVSPDGRHYYPALPYTSYHNMKTADARDLMAFLRTLPPVHGRPPAHRLAFPFSIRRGIGLWKLLYLDQATIEPDPTKSDAWNLGRYLVEGPGHCAECHSPRDMFGGIVAARRFSGGPSPDGKGKAPDITSGGLAQWSQADIVGALATGLTPDGDSLGGPMAAVVRDFAQLPESYREAVAEYLKSLPAVAGQGGAGKPSPAP